MYRYIAIFLALIACSTAKPAVVTPISYGAQFYPSAGTSQVDIRNSYNGGYSTTLGYSAPLAGRLAAPVSPFAYTAPIAKYASPAIATPFGYTAPIAKYTSPLAAAAAYATPYAAAYTPYAGGYSSPYASGYGSPYALAAPASAPYFL